MSKLMKTMTAIHVFLSIFFSLCIHLCFCGSRQGLGSSCDVEVLVRRGTVYRASPQAHVVVTCSVQHCGETVHVIWCKLLVSNGCKDLNNSEHIQINETMQLDGKLVSFLTFRRISVQDDGLYRCTEKKSGSVGHFINVSVSETHIGVHDGDGNSDQPSNNVPSDDEITSLAYFAIFLSLVLLLFTITAIVLLRHYGCKWILRHRPKPHEEPTSHMIPGLPKRSPPVLHQSLSTVNDIYKSASAPPPHLEMTTSNQLVANTSKGHSSEIAVYAKINRIQSLRPSNYSSDKGTD